MKLRIVAAGATIAITSLIGMPLVSATEGPITDTVASVDAVTLATGETGPTASTESTVGQDTNSDAASGESTNTANSGAVDITNDSNSFAATGNSNTESSDSANSDTANVVIPRSSSDGVCPSAPKSRIINIEYVINGVVTTSIKSIQSGGELTVKFDIDPDCTDPVEVSLVAYEAPKPNFDPTVADKQVVFEAVTKTFAPTSATSAKYNLSVTVPQCFYQVDFVQGSVIAKLGPKGSNNFYSASSSDPDNFQTGAAPSGGRLIASAQGGTTPCVAITDPGTSVLGVTQTPVNSAVADQAVAGQAVAGTVLARTGFAELPLLLVGLALLALGNELRRRAAAAA